MFEKKSIQNALGVIVIILLGGLIGWYVMQDLSPADSQEEDKGAMVTDGNISAQIRGGEAEIKSIPINLDLGFGADTIAQPKLDRTIVMPDRFSPEAVEILRNNITKLTMQLKEDGDSFGTWSDLANQYKIIDDFEGAAEVWEYISLATEGNTGSRINLGNIYHFQLKEYEKSETVFKEVIDINNEIVGAYTGLHELYRYSYKTDTTLAIDILKEAIVAVPDSIDIRMLLASYYTELGMKDEANAVYEKVLVMAEKVGNTNLVTIIEAAIESLK